MEKLSDHFVGKFADSNLDPADCAEGETAKECFARLSRLSRDGNHGTASVLPKSEKAQALTEEVEELKLGIEAAKLRQELDKLNGVEEEPTEVPTAEYVEPPPVPEEPEEERPEPPPPLPAHMAEFARWCDTIFDVDPETGDLIYSLAGFKLTPSSEEFFQDVVTNNGYSLDGVLNWSKWERQRLLSIGTIVEESTGTALMLGDGSDNPQMTTEELDAFEEQEENKDLAGKGYLSQVRDKNLPEATRLNDREIMGFGVGMVQQDAINPKRTEPILTLFIKHIFRMKISREGEGRKEAIILHQLSTEEKDRLHRGGMEGT